MKKYLIALALVGLTTTSCYEKLNIAPPNEITDEQVKALLATADDATVANIMNGVAGGLSTTILNTDNGTGALEFRYNRYIGSLAMRSFEANDAVFGDQATSSGFGRDEYQLVDLRMSTNATRNYPYWKVAYTWVTNANKVLNVLDDKTVGTNATMKKYQAWAYTIRAYAYNFLVENYQLAYMLGGKDKLGVPYYALYNPAQDYQPRATLQACYDSINKDLTRAIAGYTADGGSGITKDAKDDLDAGVAYFIKARVAVCTGQWADAIAACQKIIDVFGESFMSKSQYVAQKATANGKAQYYAINSGFLNLAQNPECLYGWPLAQTKDNAYHCYYYNTYGCCSGGSGANNMRIDDRLYTKINAGDYRKENFLINPPTEDYEYANGTRTKILPYANLKFACTVGTGGGTDPLQAVATSYYTDFTLMRLSEVYLMKAEAQAQSGDANGAKATLNSLLKARTGGTLNCDNYPEMAGMSALEMVQWQTRIEMWGENGLEYYNNKRWNMPVDRASSNIHWQKSGLSVPNMTLQIPQESTNFNDKIVQDN